MTRTNGNRRQALGGRGRNGNGPGDPVGRLLRVLLLRVSAAPPFGITKPRRSSFPERFSLLLLL